MVLRRSSIGAIAATILLAGAVRAAAQPSAPTPPAERKWAIGSEGRQGLLMVGAGLKWYFGTHPSVKLDMTRRVVGNLVGRPSLLQGTNTPETETPFDVLVVGELGVTHFEGANELSFLVGPRVMFPLVPQATVFGQFLIGGFHYPAPEGTDLAFQPGVGSIIPLSGEKYYLGVQLDFPIDHFEGGNQRYTRLAASIGIPIWK